MENFIFCAVLVDHNDLKSEKIKRYDTYFIKLINMKCNKNAY